MKTKFYCYLPILVLFFSANIYADRISLSDDVAEQIQLMLDNPTDALWNKTFLWEGNYGLPVAINYANAYGMKIDYASNDSLYCSGTTFYFVMQTLMKRYSKILDFSPAEIEKFRQIWYQDTDKSNAYFSALEKLDAGPKACISDSFYAGQRGDFIQFWRSTGKGHSAVFWNTVKNKHNDVIGIRYFSAQAQGEERNGLGFNTEYYAGAEGIPTGVPNFKKKLVKGNIWFTVLTVDSQYCY